MSMIVQIIMFFDRQSILDRFILEACIVRQLRNIRVCMVSSQQKLRFISKQNNFQTEKVYTFAMTTSE